MLSEDELQPAWLKLETLLTERLGKKPDLDDVLLFIGIKESGLYPKAFSEEEQIKLRELAVCDILVPARYYELYWVDDQGYPHYSQLQRLPAMTNEERENFLKPWVLEYAIKKRMI